VTVTPEALEVSVNSAGEASAQLGAPPLNHPAACNSLTTITLPWTAPKFRGGKGYPS
jgi:hypothetical protein